MDCLKLRSDERALSDKDIHSLTADCIFVVVVVVAGERKEVCRTKAKLCKRQSMQTSIRTQMSRVAGEVADPTL